MDQSGIESPELWLRGFEDVVSSLANDTSAYISRSLDGLAHRSSAKSRSDPSQKQSFPDRVVDTVLLDVLRTAIASFMGFKPEILTPAISFISLGLDSIKSVGLSKAISKAGYHVTSTDILRNATLNELAVLIQTKKSVAGDPIAHRSQSTLDINPAILSEITPESVRLSVDEEVQFFPTTALQTGMLSQVGFFFRFGVIYSEKSLTDRELQGGLVRPRISPTPAWEYRDRTIACRLGQSRPMFCYLTNIVPLFYRIRGLDTSHSLLCSS